MVSGGEDEDEVAVQGVEDDEHVVIDEVTETVDTVSTGVEEEEVEVTIDEVGGVTFWKEPAAGREFSRRSLTGGLEVSLNGAGAGPEKSVLNHSSVP